MTARLAVAMWGGIAFALLAYLDISHLWPLCYVGITSVGTADIIWLRRWWRGEV